MRTAMVSKEWCEVLRAGRGKVEDWSWEVTFLSDGVVADRHFYKTEALARDAANLFEGGKYRESEFGGIEFDKVG